MCMFVVTIIIIIYVYTSWSVGPRALALSSSRASFVYKREINTKRQGSHCKGSTRSKNRWGKEQRKKF